MRQGRSQSRSSSRNKASSPSPSLTTMIVKKSMKLPQIGGTQDDSPTYSGVGQQVNSGLISGVCSQQGKRPYQEDEYAIRPFLNQSSPANEQDVNIETHFYGLFDGHAGGRCSNYVAGSLPNVLAEDTSFFSNLPQALKRSFHQTNEQFLKVAEKMKYHDGSTGITAVVRDSKVLVANVGDCRALIISGGRPIQMSIDQKPTNPEEQKRIVALGGTVVYCMGVARVNRVLAVSRAFGNRTLRSVIRPDAEMMQRELTKDDDYLVMASDGLWDVLKNKDVCDICYSPFTQGNPQAIAEELVNAALQRGSMDNVTCICVRLTDYVQRILGARGAAGAAPGGNTGSAALQASTASSSSQNSSGLERAASLKNIPPQNGSTLRPLDTVGLSSGIGSNNNNNNNGNSSPIGNAPMPSLSRQYSTGSIMPSQSPLSSPAVDNYLYSPNRGRAASNGGAPFSDPFHLPSTQGGQASPGIANMRKASGMFSQEEEAPVLPTFQAQNAQWAAMQQQQQQLLQQDNSGGSTSGPSGFSQSSPGSNNSIPYAARRPNTMGGGVPGNPRAAFSAMPNLISMFGNSTMPPIGGSGSNSANNSGSSGAYMTDISGSDNSPTAHSSGMWNSEGDYSGSSFGSAHTESTLGRGPHSYQQKPASTSLTNMFPSYRKPPARK